MTSRVILDEGSIFAEGGTQQLAVEFGERIQVFVGEIYRAIDMSSSQGRLSFACREDAIASKASQ